MNKKRELLFSVTKKDLDISFFSGKGAGGQHRNKHMNCVRIKHSDSGTLVQCSDHKSKDRNLREASLRLTRHDKFTKWHRLKAAELMVDKEAERILIERWVEEQMIPLL